MRFARDFLWALRYWRHFHATEQLRPPLAHAWRYAARVAPKQRPRDRVKYG